MARIGIGSIMQETNTWSPVQCETEDFTCHGLYVGPTILDACAGTNTELGGALTAIEARGDTPVPLVRAWASSSGRVARTTFDELCTLLVTTIAAEAPLDGLVLSLHGAMAAVGLDDADGTLIAAAREALGAGTPIAVCLDLHANVTKAMLEAADIVTGYHTYPHTDQAATGARAASLLIDRIRQARHPVTALAKRPMLIPAEAMDMVGGGLRELRDLADARTTEGVLDVSLFPVQPWLDVEELGFGVTVTHDGDPEVARRVAEEIADRAWAIREQFTVELLSPQVAIERVRASAVRPFILAESADSPTAGACGDSPAMLRELTRRAPDLTAYLTLVDAAGVDACFATGVGGSISAKVGASLDDRFHEPVLLDGVVERVGNDSVVLTGPSYTGMAISMGRWAVVRAGHAHVLLTERPAWTIDPAVFRHVGLDPDDADIVVVRSATMFRAAYPEATAAAAVTLDLPGASTPRLSMLEFERAPRPMFPVDA